MTHAAQAALRRGTPPLLRLTEWDLFLSLRLVIEKYSKNARFCIICNYISKLIPALQSRCTRFRFAPLTADQAKPRLELVIREEK
jgi:replication factor C subunit 3/5